MTNIVSLSDPTQRGLKKFNLREQSHLIIFDEKKEIYIKEYSYYMDDNFLEVHESITLIGKLFLIFTFNRNKIRPYLKKTYKNDHVFYKLSRHYYDSQQTDFSFSDLSLKMDDLDENK